MEKSSEFRLLKFDHPSLHRNRIKAALAELNDPQQEYDALNELFEGLIEFYDTLNAPEAEMISYELTKLMYYSQVTYQDWIED